MCAQKSYKIQILRGIAMISVVAIHSIPAGLTSVFLRPFLNFSVGLFLFLSGMLSTKEKWHPWKRIWKVAIPYVIWTLIYACYNSRASLTAIPINFVKALVVGNSAPMMYYIFVYCTFTLLIPLIDKLARSKYKYVGFSIAPIEILVMRLLPLITGYLPQSTILNVVLKLSFVGWFTYFYLGYLLGNHIIQNKLSYRNLLILLGISIVLETLEGYWHLSMGSRDCGTQLKLTTLLTSTVTVLLAYQYIDSEKIGSSKFLKHLGDRSFGVFFSHILVHLLLREIPYYADFVIFPLNAVVTLLISFGVCVLGKKLLGRYGRFLGL